MEMTKERLIKIHEVAEMTGWPVSTIYKMVENFQIPFIRVPGKKNLRFSPKQIISWWEKHTVRPLNKLDASR